MSVGGLGLTSDTVRLAAALDQIKVLSNVVERLTKRVKDLEAIHSIELENYAAGTGWMAHLTKPPETTDH